MNQQLLVVGLVMLFVYLFILNGQPATNENYDAADYYQWRTYNSDPYDYSKESQYPFDYKPEPYPKRFGYYKPYFRKYGYGNY